MSSLKRKANVAKTLTIEKLKEIVQCLLEKKLDITFEDCRKCKDVEVCNIIEEVWRAGFEEGEESWLIDKMICSDDDDEGEEIDLEED